MSRISVQILFALMLSTVLGGCAHRFRNSPLEKYDAASGYRFEPLAASDKNTNSLFVCLTFSGGGTRAAALAYGVLRELGDTQIKAPASGASKRLLDEVDLISSVSGGAFTAAYYGLFGDRIFEDFEAKFLYRDIEQDLTWRLLNPWNWLRLGSWWFDRIDLAAELYNETIFEGKTFADLAKRGSRPFILINATNMSMGAQFSFTQNQFDILGSDLSDYPVANAVAASSAFPVALSPVTLENHHAPQNYSLPGWILQGLEGLLTRPGDNRRAGALAPYHLQKGGHPYVHLLDGGIADNLGLSVLLDEYRHGFIEELANGQTPVGPSPAQPIDKLLVIVVNARTKLNDDLDTSSTSPGIISTAYNAANVSIDHHSHAMLEIMQHALELKHEAELEYEAFRKMLNRYTRRGPRPRFRPPKLKTHLVEINFDQIKSRSERNEFLSMPTSLTLDRQQVAALINIGGKLLRKNNAFRRFLKELE